MSARIAVELRRQGAASSAQLDIDRLFAIVFSSRIFWAMVSASAWACADRDTRLEPPNNAPLHVVAVGYVIRNARGNPDTRKLFHIRLRRKQQFKTRRQHAHDDWRWSKRGGHWKRFANYRSIATKALLEVFAQNCHRWQRRWCGGISSRGIAGCRWGSWLGRAIRVLKVSARDDRTSHHLKEVGRYRGRGHAQAYRPNQEE